MYYARWANESEMKEQSVVLNKKGANEKASIPLSYETDKAYALTPDYPTMVIGSEGSGKTQVTVLPLIKMSMSAGNSMVINDPRGDLYQVMASKLTNEGYEVIGINFMNSSLGNSFNPFDIPYQVYQEGSDKSLKMIEEVGYYLLNDGKIVGDPFWENTAIDYFCGLTLYLFEQGNKENINIQGIYNLSNEINADRKEFMDKLDKKSNTYAYLTATLSAPPETYGSILSVFHQKIRRYIVGDDLKELLSNSNFNLMNIKDQKQAIFLVGGTSDYSDHLIPLVFSQVYYIKELDENSNQTIKMIIDEFDNLIPMRNVIKVLNYSRVLKINYTITVKNFTNLINLYGKDTFEAMKLCFANMIYLLSNDIYTLKEFSSYCGKTLRDNKEEALISIDELKRLKQFEAIILVIRCMPYRVILEPDYKIDWGYELTKTEMPKR